MASVENAMWSLQSTYSLHRDHPSVCGAPGDGATVAKSAKVPSIFVKTRFDRYFCKECRLYDDTSDKSIYHCDRCGLCRVGEGLGIDVFHCDKCHACVDLDSKDHHQCLENCLQVDCPICGEYLFTSTQPGMFLKCGHTMHAHCYEKYIEGNFR